MSAIQKRSCTIFTMIRLALLLLISAWSTSCFAQQYINSSKEKARRQLNKYFNPDQYKTLIRETDSSLQFQLRDTSVQHLDIDLLFDASGKCRQETYRLSCDSCYRKFITHLLGQQRYRWKQVAATTYFAGGFYRLIVSTGAAADFTYSIQRSDLSRNEYQQIRNKN